MDDVKKYVNCIAILQYIYDVFMDDAWTLGQEQLLVAQTMCNLYKQGSNSAETPCQVLL